MSLINDALKRATEAQPAGKPTPEMETTMKPVPQPRTVGLPVYFTPVLLFIISGACWFLIKGWDVRRRAVASTTPTTIPVQARELEETPDIPPGEGAELPIPGNRQFALNDRPSASLPQNTGATAAAAVASAESVPAVAAADEAPAASFKLQGIFYRPANPSAVVNTRTVFVGDRIANAKVKAIDQQSVTLEVAGETKVLTLQ
jgi:hypothetical protein